MQPLGKKIKQKTPTPTFNKHFVSLQIPHGYSLIPPYHQFWTRPRQKVKKWGKRKCQVFAPGASVFDQKQHEQFSYRSVI